MCFLNNEMYNLFLNTISKMNDSELENALKKAKEMLSENDYDKLLKFIEAEKARMNKQ